MLEMSMVFLMSVMSMTSVTSVISSFTLMSMKFITIAVILNQAHFNSVLSPSKPCHVDNDRDLQIIFSVRQYTSLYSSFTT